jgi:phage terminase large subunit-like protein
LPCADRPRCSGRQLKRAAHVLLASEGLAEKARADKIPYDQWRDEGYLEVTPGSTVSYEYVAHYLRDVFERHHVRKIAFDRWNIQHLKPWLLAAGFSEQMIADTFSPFGQGFQSMSPRCATSKA